MNTLKDFVGDNTRDNRNKVTKGYKIYSACVLVVYFSVILAVICIGG